MCLYDYKTLFHSGPYLSLPLSVLIIVNFLFRLVFFPLFIKDICQTPIKNSTKKHQIVLSPL